MKTLSKEENCPPTPELDRMRAITDKSQVIGEFLDWMMSTKQAFFVRCHNHSEDCIGEDEETVCGFSPDQPERINTPIELLLAEYFQIDLDKVEQERRAILAYVRERTK